VKYVSTGAVDGTTALLVLLAPLALIFLREPVRYVLVRSGMTKPAARADGPGEDAIGGHAGGIGGFFVAVMEGGLEVFEAVIMYLSNTVSFVRIGAYALAHAALCMVIFAFSGLLNHGALGTLGSLVLIVLGNVVVIVLEGLVAAVQVLRLEYYEFFGKFLSGDGKAYKPFDLKSEES
jgi:vacuolar-type H+-ATPase subunit I/STV1